MGQKQSILRRIFGDPISEQTDKDWPELRGAFAGREVERPDLAGNVTSIKPMGMFNKWRYPDTYGVTDQFGRIQLNKELIDKEHSDINDILIHEMTHAGQGAGGFLRKFYNPSKDEYEAINAEAMRKVRKDNINLPNDTGVIDPTIKILQNYDKQFNRKRPIK
jgi:hypothetical protein